ncbi:MAG: heme-degrading monooxygenase HmoA [Flavobacteriaceae bacterium]|jgi:heme-degrading monooxygenase HmoA|tara:strand:- start:17391 stop:17537 length:147 start_codon:yes stop_codon:yes gene_type:complete
MLKNVTHQNGFTEMESFKIFLEKIVTISYWKSMSTIHEWKENIEDLWA